MRSRTEKGANPLWVLPDQATVTLVNFLPAGAAVQEVIKRPIAEVLAEHDMLGWGHGMLGPGATVIDNESLKNSWRSKLTENNMALTPMPGGLPGLEVVAIKPIPRGSILVYSGLLGPIPAKDPYFAGISREQGYSARRYGNISRFMGHAPGKNNLDTFEFCNQALKSNVATANFQGIKLDTTCIQGGISGLVALRDINPGEPARWDYGSQHFYIMGITPALFTTDSNQIIEYTQYYCASASLSMKVMERIISFPATIKALVEGNSYVFIDTQQSGLDEDVFLDSMYIDGLIRADRKLLLGDADPIELPGRDCPYMKCFTPGSVTNLKNKLWLHAQSIMGDAPDLASSAPCYRQIRPMKNVPLKPEMLGVDYFLISSDDSERLTDNASKLEAAGVVVEYKRTGNTPEVYQLLIEQKSLFRSLPSDQLNPELAAGVRFFGQGASGGDGERSLSIKSNP